MANNFYFGRRVSTVNIAEIYEQIYFPLTRLTNNENYTVIKHLQKQQHTLNPNYFLNKKC
jgi:hypothetical protein